MKKSKGAISIIILFVFLLLSILLLFLLASLEQRSKIYLNTYDGLQSAYISESLCLLTFEEIKNSENFRSLFKSVSFEPPKANFADTEAGVAKLSKYRDQPTSFSKFELETISVYKNIPAKTLIIGDLINPLFYQEDGILDLDDLQSSSSGQYYMDFNFENFYRENLNFHGTTYILNEDLTAYKKNNLEIELRNISSMNPRSANDQYATTYPNQSIDSEASASHSEVKYTINNLLINAIEINRRIDILDDLQIKGLIIVHEGGSLKIHKNLHLDGVLILAPGALVEGSISGKGLVINLSTCALSSNLIFDPSLIEDYLFTLDGFIDPRIKYIKKLI